MRKNPSDMYAKKKIRNLKRYIELTRPHQQQREETGKAKKPVQVSINGGGVREIELFVKE